MKKALLIFLITLVGHLNYTFGQDLASADSLLSILEHEKIDTNQVFLLLELADVYYPIDIDKAESYLIDAITKSEKNNFVKGQASCYHNASIFYLKQNDLVKSEVYTEKVILLNKKQNDKLGLANGYLTMGSINSRKGDVEMAVAYFNKSLELSLKIDDAIGTASCYRNLGIIEANRNNYPSSIEYFEKALIIEQEFGTAKGVSDCLSNIGVVYNYQGDHVKSIEYQEKSLAVCEEIGDKSSISARLINLGVSYDDQSNYVRALECYNKALPIKIELGDKVGTSMCYNNIGEVYIDKGDYAVALEYYDKSLNIDRELDDKSGLAICLLNIGNVHFQLKDYTKAVNYYEQAYELANKISEKRILANVLNCMGEAFLKMEIYENAMENFKNALVYSNEIGDESLKAKSAYHMGEIFFKQGDYSRSLKYMEEASELHKALGEKGKLAADYVKIAEVYFLKENNTETLKYGLLSFSLAQQLGLKEELSASSEVLSKLYASQHNFKKAFDYLTIFKQTHDSIFTLESQKQILTIENRSEINQKQIEIEMQNIRLGKQADEIKQQHFKQNVLLVGLLATLIVIILIIVANVRIRKAKNIIQLQKALMEESNETLKNLNEELNVNIETVNKQKQHIEKINREITDSIQYAKYIQTAILPKNELFQKNLTDHFVLYKPKDIVSGDFYWTTELEGRTIIAAADCTGHGVPGAFMSMLGVSFLNDIINKEYITHPGVILRRLRKEVVNALHQTGKLGEQRDGMDICLCSIDFATLNLQYSGANNPLYIIRHKDKEPIIDAIMTEFENHILYELKADRMPIALYERMNRFEMREVQLYKEDRIYMFSDGYSDQFGGSEGRRMKYKPFKQLLLDNCKKTMAEQKQNLESVFYEWKQDYEQIDDVMILGFLV